MKKKFFGMFAMAGLAAGLGCDPSPAPPRVSVPPPGGVALRESDPARPLATPVATDPYGGLPYADEPLVNQRMPEEQRFVDLYKAVGSPRIMVFVNRTMEGDVISSGTGQPLWSMKSETRTPTSVSGSSTDVYVKPGDYDEVNARALDYQALETTMTDWLACGGRVTVISPTLARQRLSDQTVKEMQAGRPQVLSEVASQLGAEILVQVAARPTRQTAAGVEVRLVAEAMNIHGGQSIGRAVVDVPPPLEKVQINAYTRYLARKLMDDMSGTWQAPPPPGFKRPEATAPVTPTPAPAATIPPEAAPPPAAPATPAPANPPLPAVPQANPPTTIPPAPPNVPVIPAAPPVK